MSFAKKMQGVSNRLIGKFDERAGDGRVKLIRAGAKVFNPLTGEFEFAASAEYFLTVVSKTVSAGLVNGTTIQAGDQLMSVSKQIRDSTEALVDITPTTADKILSDGIQWSIVDAPPVDYTGKPLTILFKLQLRK